MIRPPRSRMLPATFFHRMVEQGRLVTVDCPLSLPALTYYITYRNDYHRDFYVPVNEVESVENARDRALAQGA